MKKEIFSVLLSLALVVSFSLLMAVPAVANGAVPNPTFATVSIPGTTTPSANINIGWERGTVQHSGTDAIHVTTSTATLDYAMVIVPTNFVLSSTSTISYWGYTVSGDVKAPDEIYLFLDINGNGTFDIGAGDILLTSHKPGPAASAWYGLWHEWSLTDLTEPLNQWHIVPGYTEVVLGNYIDKDYSVLAIALTAGPSTADIVSGTPVNVDVYFDELTVNGSVVLDDDTGTIDVPVPFAGLPAPCIQDAIDAALSGDTINVVAGTYAGAIVDKDVTISGAPGGASVITSGVQYKVGGPAYTTAFRLDGGADGTEINNFTINNNQPASFYFAVFSRGIDNVTIDRLAVNDTVQGINNWGGSGWTITNNTVTDTVAAGGGGIGIFLGAKPSDYRTCSNNLVQYNVINVTATADDYSCPGICACLDLRYGAYALLDGTEDVSGNQILNNDITASGANNGVGIEVGTILGNDENDPDRTDPTKIAAIMAAAAVHDNTVQQNTVDGTDMGIYFYNVTDLTVTLNTIKNSVGDGISAEHGQSGTVVLNNTFTNNNFQVTDTTIDTETLDPLDIESILGGNLFDHAVTVDHSGASLLHTIWSKIQDGIDAAVGGDTVNVAAGTYDERININKAITLRGATADVSKKGFVVPDGYAYNTAEQSVIKPSTPLEQAVVLVSSDSVIFDGFVVANEVCQTGGVFQDLVEVASSVSAPTGIQVLNCVLGPNTNTAAQDGTKGRSGLCVVGPHSAGPVKLIAKNNKAFDNKGNGCGIMLVAPYGPTYHSGTAYNNFFSGSVIEDNEITGNHRTGIELAGGVQGGISPSDYVVIRNNIITNNGWFNVSEKDALKFGHGIMFIRGASDKNNADAAGSKYIKFEGNQITGNEKSGVYMGPINSDISFTGNTIQNNGLGTGGYSLWDGVRIDLDEAYYNPPKVTDYTRLANINFSRNDIVGNGSGLGLNVIQIPAAGHVNAINNWWGANDGPSGVGPGSGDAVSANVDYDPWLRRESDTPSATGTGTVTFDVDSGGITGLTAWAEGTLPTAGKPAGVVFPHGLFSFNITSLAPSATVTVTITFPAAIPAGAQYWKCQGGNWINCTSLLGDNDGDNILTLTLTDGELGDADGVANGTIVDPGGPGAAATSGGGGIAGGLSAAYAASPLTLAVNMQGNITTVKMTKDGVLSKTCLAQDAAGKHTLQLDKDTKVMLAGNIVPLLLRFREASTKPPTPENTVIVGTVYEFNAYSSTSATTPSPITISPPARLILTYDPDKLPKNASEVFIANYDTEKGWLALAPVSGVVAEVGKAQGQVSHLSLFAVLAKLAEPASTPAKFKTSNLSISPTQAGLNQEVTISLNVANTGGTSGSYSLELKVDGTTKSTKQVTIAAGASQKVNFTTTGDAAGKHQVEVAGLNGEFDVTKAAKPSQINWWLIGGIIAAVILSPGIWMLMRWRRFSSY